MRGISWPVGGVRLANSCSSTKKATNIMIPVRYHINDINPILPPRISEINNDTNSAAVLMSI